MPVASQRSRQAASSGGWSYIEGQSRDPSVGIASSGGSRSAELADRRSGGPTRIGAPPNEASVGPEPAERARRDRTRRSGVRRSGGAGPWSAPRGATLLRGWTHGGLHPPANSDREATSEQQTELG